MFRIIVHKGAEPWTPPPKLLPGLRDEFSDVSGTVHIWPRSEITRVTGRHDPPYAYRGFTRDTPGPDVSHVFVDETETPHSILWLIAHELCHHRVNQRPGLKARFDRRRPNHLDPASDAFHLQDPHELYCDETATRILGYTNDRQWWRQRTPTREGSQFRGLGIEDTFQGRIC